jgi:hypothetical protein
VDFNLPDSQACIGTGDLYDIPGRDLSGPDRPGNDQASSWYLQHSVDRQTQASLTQPGPRSQTAGNSPKFGFKLIDASSGHYRDPDQWHLFESIVGKEDFDFFAYFILPLLGEIDAGQSDDQLGDA